MCGGGEIGKRSLPKGGRLVFSSTPKLFTRREPTLSPDLHPIACNAGLNPAGASSYGAVAE